MPSATGLLTIVIRIKHDPTKHENICYSFNIPVIRENLMLVTHLFFFIVAAL